MSAAKDLRIVYMGTPEFAVTPLSRLVDEGYNIVGVVTMPDKPSGRGLKMTMSAVKEYAVSKNIPVLQPEKLRDESFLKELRHLKPDLGIVIAFRMLPEVVWSMPKLGTFNLHASLLPQYRGAAPINWAVMNGEKETGVTTFMLDREIDTGKIIARKNTPVYSDENCSSLHDRLMVIGADLVVESVEKVASGDYELIDQSSVINGELKSAPKIFKEDCKIDWSNKTQNIYNKIRGLSYYPAAWSTISDGTQNIDMKIFESKMEVVFHGKTVGSIYSDGKNYLKVAVADGFIDITELQIAGKKRMNIQDFLRGFKNIEQFSFV